MRWTTQLPVTTTTLFGSRKTLTGHRQSINATFHETKFFARGVAWTGNGVGRCSPHGTCWLPLLSILLCTPMGTGQVTFLWKFGADWAHVPIVLIGEDGSVGMLAQPGAHLWTWFQPRTFVRLNYGTFYPQRCFKLSLNTSFGSYFGDQKQSNGCRKFTGCFNG